MDFPGSWMVVEEDKRLHLMGGAAIGALAFPLAESLLPPGQPTWRKVLVSVAVASVVGAAKEASDALAGPGHNCDSRDWIATTAGGAVGAVLSATVVFRW